MTSNRNGVQEKAEEIIVKKDYTLGANEHRTPEFYRINIAKAFAECRRVVHEDGVVSIVFGHGDPDAWRALLDAISEAGLVLTGAWPANTEKGGSAGSANIQTTLTLACRPAPANRPDGRVAEVDAEMRRVIAERVRTVWNPSGLSYVDQKMAAAGPALEVVGQYARILDKRGQPVDLTRYLPLARQAVTEAHNLSFDSLPLDTFDQKTRFALEWVRSFGRRVQAASEARWQRLAADLEESDTAGVLAQVDKGVRLAFAKEAKVEPDDGLSLFEVALAAAAAWRDGTLADAAAAVRGCKVEPDDPHFWACLQALSQNLPETDKDGAVWTSMVRNRDALAAGVGNAEAVAQAVVDREKQEAKTAELNPKLFADPNSLFGQEGN
jgi:putative DNA methylase